MPTGYTADVTAQTTLREFVLKCARAFGATITMRDDPLDKAILEEFKPDTRWHEEQLADARARAERFTKMGPKDAAPLAEKEYREACERHDKSAAERRAKKEAYLALRAKVADWRPPTPDHDGIKRFMLEQLDGSIDFDCHEYPPPERQSPREWLSAQRDSAVHDIAYHTKHIAEEISRTHTRNKWVRDLRDSLPKEPTP